MYLKIAIHIAQSLIVILLTLSQSFAQDVSKADELVKQLEVKPQSEIRTRSISVNVANKNQGRASFNTIQFEYNSATLTQESTGQLMELGKALADDRLIDESFMIEGHADAHGDNLYNKELSLRRATTVKNFLATRMGIEDQRLQVVGHGEDKPRTDDPYDAENRRVDVVNLKVYD